MLKVKNRLLASYLLAIVALAGAFGAVVYWLADRQVRSLDLPQAEIAERLYTLRLGTALAFLVCILVAVVLSRHLAQIFVARTADLAARCRALANNEPLPPRGNAPRDDFDNLALEFDAMAGRLRRSAEQREQALAAVREANAHLEQRVTERTLELTESNKKLRNEIENRLHVEALLAEAALTDALTGLLNRRAMMEMLEQASTQLKPGELGLSVILADVDHFKSINDQYGHAAGDRVLAAIGGKLRDICGGQQQVYVARWGGEEFLILMPQVRLASACKHAEHIRREIHATRIEDTLNVSISLGVSEIVGGEDPDACLRRCDQALYKAKDAGRNTVVAAQGTLFATMS